MKSDVARGKWAAFRLLVLCLAAWSTPAGAQAHRSPRGGASPAESDKDADAERLFREGQKLLEERRYGDACPKFEAAYKKDRQLGTLLNLAYCHKEQGASWQAWIEFKEAEVKAIELKRNDRRDFARKKMTELEKSLVRVVVEPPPNVELTAVLLEDHHVPEAEKGIVFASEPGERKLTFRAKGKKQVVELVTIVKRDRPQRIVVPPMEDQETEARETPAPALDEPTPAPSFEREPQGGSGQKTVAIVLAGVGLVGVGVGAVSGLMTLSNPCTVSAKQDNPSGCPDTPDGRDTSKRGETTGMISNVSFGVGGAALLAAVVLYLTAPSATSGATVTGGGGLRLTAAIGTSWAGLGGRF